MTSTIERVARLSSRDVRECIRKSQPMIATEMLKTWKASTLWTFDFFSEHYGTDKVALSDGRFQPLATLPLADCLHIIRSLDLGNTYERWGATPYIQDWLLLDLHPELKEHVELPEWFRNWERTFYETFRPRTPYRDVVALAGPKGATTYIHRDRHRTHAWLAQLVGRKKWTIFPPDQYYLVHKKHLEEGAPAAVNIANPDFEAFPGFKDATPIEFVLHPGELVFVPSGWLHQVTSLEPTISLSGNFVDGSNIGVFLKDACREAWESGWDRWRLAPSLQQDCQQLANQLGGEITSSPKKTIINAPWEGRQLRVTAARGGISWTLANYDHGRKYTSFFVDRRTVLAELGLDTQGLEAVRELSSISPRHEFRVITALSTSNITLFGKFTEDLCSANRRVLDALVKLTESLAPERALPPETSPSDATSNVSNNE